MIRFLLDVGVGKKTLEQLQVLGSDAISVLDLNPEMADADILSVAHKEKRMVITMDKDFGELVYRSGKQHNGVLLLRLEDATGDEKAVIVQQIVEKFASQIEGHFCVFQNGQLRIR